MNEISRQPTPYRLRIKRTRRWKIGAVLLVLAVAMALVHAAEHVGVFTAISPHLDDLVLGWPMAMIIAFGAAVLMGSDIRR